ncbi:hypothetical protein DL98DRAFT_278956 [Cadophora sp. DSE1049]|nr:hypothetical protein DL98DRAFT_278956 [Cadophora sp. DSE1049]
MFSQSGHWWISMLNLEGFQNILERCRPRSNTITFAARFLTIHSRNVSTQRRIYQLARNRLET